MSVFTISILSAMCLIRILLHVRPSLLADASLRRDVISGIHWMVGTAIGVILVTTFLVRAFYVPSRSMQPTLMVRDLFLANRLSYWLRAPQVDDIAVFRPLAGQAEKSGFMVKRVVAIGGDVLTITDGKLWRNGHAVSESYLANDMVMAEMAQFQVPPGHYFVMGDNRGNSEDSRVWRQAIPESHFVGTAWLRLYPPSRAGWIK